MSPAWLQPVPLVSVAVAALLLAPPAAGQTPSAHNRGALRFTGGVDAPSIYFFRGIRQEREPKITVQPFGEVRIALSSDDQGVPTLSAMFGVWNSIQTGSSGREGPSRRLHYEEDFYASLTFGLGGGLDVTTAFTAHSSPNSIFNTRKEASLSVSTSNWLNPSALIAFELSDFGQADSGSNQGTYLELGAGPKWTLMSGGPAVEFPVRAGFSLKDYYEGRAGDTRFGFLEVGGVLTLPLKLPERFGAWDVHGGGSWLRLGDATKAVNIDKDGNISDHEILWSFGVGLTY